MLRTLWLLLVGLSNLTLAASHPLAPPPDETLQEARSLVESFKQNERGPYSRIRWFCNDGSTQPPQAYACAKHGGGRQHAEYSVQRIRLAELGWPVGTVVAALTWEELWQPQQRQQRLRALPLERYLEAVDDGWVLRRARHYRGRVQLEDEEWNGRTLLLKLLSQPAFLQDEFLLTREIIQIIAHGTTGGDRTRSIRHLAQELAEADAAFAKLRIEIHSRPSAETASRVREWLAGRTPRSEVLREKALRLADGLDELFGPAGRKLRLRAAAVALAEHSPQATRLIREAQGAAPAQHIERLSQAIQQLRKDVTARQPEANLRRLDLLTELAAELRTSALEQLDNPLSRRQLLTLASDLLRGAWGLGLLSSGEREALSTPLDALLTTARPAAAEYATASRRLALAAAWAAQTVRYSFAEALISFTALEPKAARFVDDLLRDTLLLPLGEVANRLALDAAQLSGIDHRVFGQPANGLLGINPGIARGRLHLLEGDALARGVRVAEDEIVVLTETVADLDPVAGILTLGEGNPLSHVQMLARNLGIPNASVAPELLPRLRSQAGRQVLLAAAGDGRVLLERIATSVQETSPQEAAVVSKVKAPLPNLSQPHPLPLAQLHSGLSGKLVGPKAANVGELNRLFPDRISPAIALPFGIFAEHTIEPRQRLKQGFERFRAGGLDRQGLESVLDAVRQSVSQLSLRPTLVEELTPMLEQAFGPAGSYGLFVRSDTNAEDLPEFTGAGLNQTIPNVVGLEPQLAAVSQVWSSVYTRRAMAWRMRILENPEAVFASVLLMKSVPSEKSGVLVTTDLTSGKVGLTVSVAWGVGGAVDNESAASRVLRPDGTTLLLAEAKAPYRRALAAEGGIVWRPAQTGPVLTDGELDALRTLAQEVLDRYPPVLDEHAHPLPWDIEFAFAKGKLWLLQIRPLIQRGRAAADALVNARIPAPRMTGSVALDDPPHRGHGD